VTDEIFTVALGGRQWELPHLPFRAIKKIQPVLFQLYADLSGADASPAGFARFNETQLDRLAEAAYLALSVVDRDLSREAFFDLPFSVGELMQAFPSIAQAAGLRAVQPDPSQDAAREAPRKMGESISIA
jgi:hypothetical protein